MVKLGLILPSIKLNQGKKGYALLLIITTYRITFVNIFFSPNLMKPDKLKTLINLHPVLLIDFYADWCEPCKMLDGILDEISINLTGKVHILKVDVDESEEIKIENNIMSIPTLMFYINGELKWRMAGFLMAKDLIRKIEEFI